MRVGVDIEADDRRRPTRAKATATGKPDIAEADDRDLSTVRHPGLALQSGKMVLLYGRFAGALCNEPDGDDNQPDGKGGPAG